jgi:hypothetical protein
MDVISHDGGQFICCSNDECFGPHTTAVGEDAVVQWNTRPSPTGDSEAGRLADAGDESIWLVASAIAGGLGYVPLNDMLPDSRERFLNTARVAIHRVLAALRAQPPQPTDGGQFSPGGAFAPWSEHFGPQPGEAFTPQPTGDVKSDLRFEHRTQSMSLIRGMHLLPHLSIEVRELLVKLANEVDDLRNQLAAADSRIAEAEQQHLSMKQAAGLILINKTEAEKQFARAEQAEQSLRVARETLTWIHDQQYIDRSTVSPDNAWEAWQRLNKQIVAIYDRARAALSTEAGKKTK